MLCAKFSWTSSSEKFKRSHCIFAIFAIISLLVVLLYPFFSWINCVTFSENDSYNDFGVKEFLVSNIYICYLPIIYLWRKNDPLYWFCLIQWYFMLSLIVIGQVVLESKTKIVYKIYRWMLDKKAMRKAHFSFRLLWARILYLILRKNQNMFCPKNSTWNEKLLISAQFPFNMVPSKIDVHKHIFLSLRFLFITHLH